MDIGHRMKELRIQYGLTQQELADRAELTKDLSPSSSEIRIHRQSAPCLISSSAWV